MQLEGLRGVAASIVVFYHILLIFYPNVIYGLGTEFSSPQHMRFEDDLQGSLFGGLYSGLFAVSVFFVLSGFVLTIGFFMTGYDRIIKKLAAKRYVRLMIPALVSVLLAFTIIATGLSSYREQAASIVGGGSANIQWNFVPNLFEAIKQGVWSIFVTGEDSYNKVLWTMKYEFIGSFAVFIIALVFGRAKYRFYVYAALLVALFNTWYVGFIFGMILADLCAHNRLEIKVKSKRALIVAILFIGGLLIGGYPVAAVEGTPYAILHIESLTVIENTSLYLGVAATMLVAAILMSKRLSLAFAHKSLVMIGRYTYSLYLTHILVLLTLTTFLFVSLSHYVGYNKAVFFAVILSSPVIIGGAWLFERYVDRPSINLSNRLAESTEILQ